MPSHLYPGRIPNRFKGKLPLYMGLSAEKGGREGKGGVRGGARKGEEERGGVRRDSM